LESNIGAIIDKPKRQQKEKTKKAKEEKIPSATISLQLYQQGKTVEEIAKERSLSVSTIEGHLTQHVKTGELDVAVFADEAIVKQITEVLLRNPDKKHGELKSFLPAATTFTQIRAVANHIEWLKTQGATV
jgi:uncharacterized protein YpbB